MDGVGPRDLRTVATARMQLTPAGVGDLAPMAALHADERVWSHLPTGRHKDVEQTRTYLVERERQWRQDGLSYWIARLREPIGDLAAGTVAGIGGCAIPGGATWWNLYYRLTPEVHRHGLATELCLAAIDAAHETRRSLPVIAFLVEHNHASKATAERAGLHLAWRGPDAGNPDPAAVRLIYSDRRLDDTRLNALIKIS
jgi:RimJ/RimL family protein N-acetyltransferase